MADIAVKIGEFTGAGFDRRPLTFSIGGRAFNVMEVSDRWYGERYDYFELRADDGYDYILRHDRVGLRWELVVMEKSDEKG